MFITKVALEVLNNSSIDLFSLILKKFPELKSMLDKNKNTEKEANEVFKEKLVY